VIFAATAGSGVNIDVDGVVLVELQICPPKVVEATQSSRKCWWGRGIKNFQSKSQQKAWLAKTMDRTLISKTRDLFILNSAIWNIPG